MKQTKMVCRSLSRFERAASLDDLMSKKCILKDTWSHCLLSLHKIMSTYSSITGIIRNLFLITLSLGFGIA